MGGRGGPSWAPVPQLRTACPPPGQHPLTLGIGHPGSVYFGHWASCAVAFGHLGFHAPWALGTLGTRQTGGQSAWHWVPRASRAFGHRAPWASCTSVLRALGVACPKIPAPWEFGTPALGTLGIVCPKIPAPWALGTLGTVCRGICAHCAHRVPWASGISDITFPELYAPRSRQTLGTLTLGVLCSVPRTMGTAHHGHCTPWAVGISCTLSPGPGVPSVLLTPRTVWVALGHLGSPEWGCWVTGGAVGGCWGSLRPMRCTGVTGPLPLSRCWDHWEQSGGTGVTRRSRDG